MNPWNIAIDWLGWFVVALIGIAAFVATLFLVVVIVWAVTAGVQTIRQALHPTPESAPREPGTTDILSGGGSDG